MERMERKNRIGGSDIGAIAGVDPYRTKLDVYMEKKGLIDKKPLTPPMYWGNRLEPIVAEEFSSRMGLKIKKANFVKHHNISYFGGHPDYYVINDKGYVLHGVEVKTAGFYKHADWGQEGTDDVPDAYNLQCQWYMFLTGLGLFYMPTLIGGNEFRIYVIERNDKIISSIKEMAKAFWENYVLRTVPPPPEPEDIKTLNQLYPEDTGRQIDCPKEIRDDVESLRTCIEMIKKLETKKDEAIANIKWYMKDASIMVGDGFKIHWKQPKPSVKVDWKALAESYKPSEEQIAKFTKQVYLTRRFMPKFKKGDNDDQ